MVIEQPRYEPIPAESSLKLRNRLQLELAKRHCAECDNDALTEYVFAELSPAVHRLLEEQPNLLQDYARAPEATILRVEVELHLTHAPEADTR